MNKDQFEYNLCTRPIRDVLIALRNDGSIKSFETTVEHTSASKDHKTVTGTLKVDGLGVLDSSMTYNPDSRIASEVLSIIAKDIENRIIRVGIAALLSNKSKEEIKHAW